MKEEAQSLFPIPQLRPSKGNLRNRMDRAGEFFISAVAFVAITIIFLIFIYVAREAAPLLWRSVDGASISSPFQAPYTWQPISGVPKYNILPLIVGTLKITLIAMLFATPLGLAAALYTAEFAPPRAAWTGSSRRLKCSREFHRSLSVFSSLIVMASWIQDAFGLEFRLNALTAGIGLAFAVIPLIYTVSEDALTAVPRVYRELLSHWARRRVKLQFESFCLPPAPAYVPRSCLVSAAPLAKR